VPDWLLLLLEHSTPFSAAAANPHQLDFSNDKQSHAKLSMLPQSVRD